MGILAKIDGNIIDRLKRLRIIIIRILRKAGAGTWMSQTIPWCFNVLYRHRVPFPRKLLVIVWAPRGPTRYLVPQVLRHQWLRRRRKSICRRSRSVRKKSGSVGYSSTSSSPGASLIRSTQSNRLTWRDVRPKSRNTNWRPSPPGFRASWRGNADNGGWGFPERRAKLLRRFPEIGTRRENGAVGRLLAIRFQGGLQEQHRETS